MTPGRTRVGLEGGSFERAVVAAALLGVLGTGAQCGSSRPLPDGGGGGGGKGGAAGQSNAGHAGTSATAGRGGAGDAGGAGTGGASGAPATGGVGGGAGTGGSAGSGNNVGTGGSGGTTAAGGVTGGAGMGGGGTGQGGVGGMMCYMATGGTAAPACLSPGADCTDSASCCYGAQCGHSLCGDCLPPGAACSPTVPCCGSDGTCTNGKCASPSCAKYAGSSCSATQLCCAGMMCKSGQCVYPEPACQPDGGLCNATHPCCSGKPCCNGVCGSLCGEAGADCDADHPCCRREGGTCTNGKCVNTTCVPTESFVGTPALPCCNGHLPMVNGWCHFTGEQGPGYPCRGDFADLVSVCQDQLACYGGVCREINGCVPAGSGCLSASLYPGCCSGVCSSGYCL